MSKSQHHTTVTVPLDDRTYPIYIGANIIRQIGPICRKHRIDGTIVIVTDSTVGSLYRRPVEQSLRRSGFSVRTVVIPSGEKQKNLNRAEKIYTQLLKWNIGRSATIIALGGGVIGDLAGFVAATYQRGIGFAQIPTTLLAQVDSSVGGKVGVNHPLAKNMIGAFYQPQFVLADTTVLKTLPRRELVCGLGEIIKYGIILDKEFFAFVRNHCIEALTGDPQILKAMVRRSCELKASVVSHDEREQGLRAILNFGHTIGHALERAGKFSALKHGEAVLWGMMAETHIASRQSMINDADVREIETVIGSIPLPKVTRIPLRANDMIATMLNDKKSKNGEIRMVLPTSLGKVTLPMAVSANRIGEAITYLKKYGS